MTDKKLTDNEIIKALECLFGCVDCRECPYSPRYEFPLCQQQVAKDTLDFIIRQQAEYENLKVENQSLRSAANSLKMHYEEAQAEIKRLKESLNIELENFATEYDNKIKAEAIKEFAERLDNKAMFPHEINDDYAVGLTTIDNLLKELVGDDNGEEKE